MTKTNMIRFAKKALLTTAALSGLGYGMVVASSVENFVSPKQAIKAEAKASKAFSKHNYIDAISWGEQAVLGDPRNADYRMLLGQANLSAGHFASAETLFNDVVTLDPGHARAALNLALTQIALDHGADARHTLDVHRDQIAAADLGLAYALAGDAPNGARILETAARADGATVKTRQNLALAYALSGRWDEARVTASQDLSPDMVEQRMSDWAQMVHPKAAWDQVATLLHVTPTNDAGLPFQLALRDAPTAPAMAVNTPVAQPQPVATPEVAAPQAMTPRFETATATAADVPSAPVFAQPEPQPVPAQVAMAKPARIAPLIQAESGPAKRFIAERARAKAPQTAHSKTHPLVHLAAHHTGRKGQYAVQIGAFPNEAIAKAAWNRDVKKVAALRNYDPAGSHFKLRSSSFYRLAVTGFTTHDEAAQVCAKMRASGSACFVRGVAGDQLAAWARPASNVKMAVHHPKQSAKPVMTAAKTPAPQTAQAKPIAKPVAKPAPKQVAIAPRSTGSQLAAKR